jgi:arylsulfatase A-like enzyme
VTTSISGTKRAENVRIRETLWYAVLGAMVAGAVHVFYVMWRIHVLGHFTWTSRELPWFSPLAYLACFLLVAIPLAIVSAIWPRFITRQFQVWLIATLTLLAICLHVQSVSPWAELALAAGAGFQIARLVAHNHVTWLRRAKWTSGVLAAVMLVSGVPEIVGSRVLEGRRLASLVSIDGKAPNVILLILDTVRAQNVSVYGYERKTTPVLEQFAADGVVFTSAIAPAPWTAPTHATMLTGRYGTQTGITYLTPMSDTVPTVAEAFRDHGYATGAFMGNAGFAGRQTGFDRGFVHYEDFPPSFQQAMWSATLTQTRLVQQLVDGVRDRNWSLVLHALIKPDLRVFGVRRGDRNSSDEVAMNFLNWRARTVGRPFFAMLNFFDAHDPYPSPFAGRFGDAKNELNRYDGAIAFEDSIIGALAHRLKERGELDRTVFVVVADHGEQFGEHSLKRHGNSLFIQLLHVPLIIRAPGLAPAARRDLRVVSLRDLPATLLDLAGITDHEIPGVSLATAWRDSVAEPTSIAISEVERSINEPPAFPSSRGPMKAVIDDRWHYIRRGDGEERVYAWKTDAREEHDLAKSPDGSRVIDESRALIAKTLDLDWPSKQPGRQQAVTRRQ